MYWLMLLLPLVGLCVGAFGDRDTIPDETAPEKTEQVDPNSFESVQQKSESLLFEDSLEIIKKKANAEDP